MKKTLAALAAPAALLAATLLAAPIAAGAQEVPSYAAQDAQDQQIRGRVENFDGGYNLQVRDDQGYVDNVELHDGTIINPTGLTIAPGMVVSILGYNDGSYFAANEVDTPYSFDAGVPYYDGHPWGYYGPSIDLDFFFGNAGWWHGNDFGGGFRYDRGVRIYNDVHVRNDYRGGYRNDSYRGGTNAGYRDHAYVSPPSNGYGHAGFGQSQPGRTYTTQPSRVGFPPQTHPGGFAPGTAGGFTRTNNGGGYGFRNVSHGAPAAPAAPRSTGGGFRNTGGGSSFHGGGGGGSHGGGGGEHHR